MTASARRVPAFSRSTLSSLACPSIFEKKKKTTSVYRLLAFVPSAYASASFYNQEYVLPQLNGNRRSSKVNPYQEIKVIAFQGLIR